MAKWGKCDFKQLKNMQKQLEAAEKNIDDFCALCAKELSARLITLAIKRTPVGQYPAESGMTGGTLKRGWTGGIIEKQGNAYVVSVINQVFYASFVEYGHRTSNHKGWVEGKFMLTISEKEIERMAPQLLEKKLQKFLMGCMNNAK